MWFPIQLDATRFCAMAKEIGPANKASDVSRSEVEPDIQASDIGQVGIGTVSLNSQDLRIKHGIYHACGPEYEQVRRPAKLSPSTELGALDTGKTKQVPSRSGTNREPDSERFVIGTTVHNDRYPGSDRPRIAPELATAYIR